MLQSRSPFPALLAILAGTLYAGSAVAVNRSGAATSTATPKPAAASAARPAAPTPLDAVRARAAVFERDCTAWEEGLERSAQSAAAGEGIVHSVNDDLRTLVQFSSAAQSRGADRERLRTALAAGNVEESGRLLDSLEAGLVQDTTLARSIVRYWTLRTAAVANRARFERWRAAGALAAADVAALEPLFQRFEEQGNKHEFDAASTNTWPELESVREKIWNERAMELVRQGPGKGKGAIERAALLEWHSRSAECPAFIPVSSGGSKPRLDATDSAGPDAYYPDEARLRNEEGAVTLWVEVSESGCPQRALVLVPSGYDPLDKAALDWLFDSHFLAAESNGKLIAASSPLRVRFKMQ
jgi:TonB family protein